MEERERFVRGTLTATAGVVVFGLAAFGLFGLWDWALGFIAGALVSLVSFRLIIATVARLAQDPASRPRRQRSWWVGSLLRLLGAAVLLFLVVGYLPVNLIGLAVGLLAVQIGMASYLLLRLLSRGGRDLGAEERNP
jgi:F0F1-type ATP synthase assembly protein I